MGYTSYVFITHGENTMTIAQTALNSLQTAALRVPCLIAAATGATLVGEVACRTVQGALSQIGFTGESSFAKRVSHYIPDVRPYRHIALKELVKKALIVNALGILDVAAVKALCGPAPTIYNDVLQWFGPIRIDDAAHPLFTLARSSYEAWRA